jgi:UDP-N-acetylglucosamine:LPS N-acetylglucosamine transferase/membrane protein DedA with SNARE-associated domain
LNAFFIEALHQYGYPALWLIVFVAAVGAPVSGNLLLYAAGAFAAFGDFNIIILFFVGLSSAVMGDGAAYLLGWKIGAPLINWLETQKRFRFISPRAIARGRNYFNRRAGWAIFLTRFLILVLGGPINWLAGAERYPYRRFLLWDVSGQILGAVIPLGVGYVFAASWGEAESIFGAFSGLALAFIAALIIVVLVFQKIRANKGAEREGIYAVSLLNEKNMEYEVQLRETLSDQAQTQTNRAGQSLESIDEVVQALKPPILILFSHSGGGHLNLAQALKDILEARYTVTIADPQSRGVERFYTFVSRRFVKFLDWQYIWTDSKVAAWWLQNILVILGHKRMTSIIERVQPKLIIATHAMLSYAVARANESSVEHIPLVFQLTDLERVHLTWFTEKHADAYLAPTREIFVQALEQGINKEHLYLTGRPVRHQFTEIIPDTRASTLTDLGLDPQIFTLFLQGGAKGSAGVDRIIKNICAIDVPIQIILAAGDNRQMAERYAHTEHISILPFTTKIAPYMAAADIIVGKAGASFISEAFLLEKPFLVTAIISAQEGPSLKFIERYNLGWVCLETEAQQALLTKLATNHTMLAEKVQSIRTYKTWNMQANQEIGTIIDRLLMKGVDLLEVSSQTE